MRRLFVYLLYTLAALILLLIAGSHLFHGALLKKPLESLLSQRSGYQVTIQNMDYRLMHPYTLLLQGVSVKSGDKALFSSQSLYLSVASLDPWHRQYQIAQLSMQHPRFNSELLPGLQKALHNSRISFDEISIEQGVLQTRNWLVNGLSLELNQLQLTDKPSQIQYRGQLSASSVTTRGAVFTNLFAELSQQQGKLTLEPFELNYRQGSISGELNYDLASQDARIQGLSIDGARLEISSQQSLTLPKIPRLHSLSCDGLRIKDLSLSSYKRALPLTINQLSMATGPLTLIEQGQWLDWQQQKLTFDASASELHWGLLDTDKPKLKGEYDRDKLSISASGEAFKGNYQLEFNTTPATAMAPGKIRIRNLRLDNMELPLSRSWFDSGQAWLKQADDYSVELNKINFNQLRLLSYDSRYPLSVKGLNLHLNDFALDPSSTLMFKPLASSSYLHTDWLELVYGGIWTRQGQLDMRLSQQQLQLLKLNSTLPNGSFTAEASINLDSPTLEGQLALQGKQVDLGQLSGFGRNFSPLEGKVDLKADLSGSFANQKQLLDTLSGTLTLHGSPLFLQRLKLSPWLDGMRSKHPVKPAQLYRQLLEGAPPTGNSLFATALPRFNLYLIAKQGDLTINSSFATLEQQLRLTGHYLLPSQSYQNLKLQLVNEQGCLAAGQLLNGPVSAPHYDMLSNQQSYCHPQSTSQHNEKQKKSP
ncbi:AsmA family protein [Dongshaea marina]|uniref:AsmA family protein n=1 Tax=Dongshaea marina TaxID=2047966 RepID=UPI000D3E4B9B|nr:AsmA family protein [Dongshaea marina]